MSVDSGAAAPAYNGPWLQGPRNFLEEENSGLKFQNSAYFTLEPVTILTK